MTKGTKLSSELTSIRSKTHKTLAKVKDDYLRRHNFNTAIAAIMELSNAIPGDFLNAEAKIEERFVADEAIESILLMLAPITPHLCQYLWWQMYPGESIVDKEWPEAIEELLVDENIKIAVQINGKLRSELQIAKDASSEEVEARALEDEKIMNFIKDSEVKKVIYVPGKIINIVL